MSSNWTNYSVNARDDEAAGPHAVSEDVPACTSCKKRKLRCSRETPACSHCLRLSLECAYTPKQKPGLKTGALESLTRRVAFLEKILLDEEGRIRPSYDPDNLGNSNAPSNNGTGSSEIDPQVAEERVDSFNQPPTPARSSDGRPNDSASQYQEERPVNPRKRKLDQPTLIMSLAALEDINIAEHLPAQPLLSRLVDYFCISFHHWIPYLHKQRLRDRACDPSSATRSNLVLHSVVATTLRHMDPQTLYLDEEEIAQQIKISRFIVETCAMRTVSLESLRALVILAFGHLNDGNARMAWPLIGSLTRTVDYLQLTVEPTASFSGALVKPLQLVQFTNEWTELEERRRLFWVIFLLDRFCSVSTGWNTSLTSEDVHRRLPADGGYFTREEPVTTPYFGIWNKAAARIGRSLAHVPAQYNEEDPVTEQVQGTSPGSASGVIDSSKLGAFAYCVEATESLSQVTTFFLSQRINWHDKEHAVGWLTRFKELDLRLVQWKMFLPPRWKDSDISQDTQVVDMDPNLTLAHITHNTSMILLHHAIAYPPREWSNYVALPKECSAQTCQLAAVEASNIVGKFLTHSRIPFVNVQFAFCAFVAAKALLFEHQVTKKAIRPEFERLLCCLGEMSSRWAGKLGLADGQETNQQDGIPSNQAGKYAHYLAYLHDACQRNPKFTFNLYDHSCRRPAPSRNGANATSRQISSPMVTRLQRNHRPSFSSLHSPTSQSGTVSSHSPVIPGQGDVVSTPTMYPTSNGVQSHLQGELPPSQIGPQATPQYTPATPGAYPGTVTNSTVNGQMFPDQSLMDISDTLMGSQFLDMDRVITFEDANFFLPGDAFRWQ